MLKFINRLALRASNAVVRLIRRAVVDKCCDTCQHRDHKIKTCVHKQSPLRNSIVDVNHSKQWWCSLWRLWE